MKIKTFFYYLGLRVLNTKIIPYGPSMLSRWNPPGVNPPVGLHPYLVGSTLGVNPPEKGVNPPVGLHLLPGGFHL